MFRFLVAAVDLFKDRFGFARHRNTLASVGRVSAPTHSPKSAWRYDYRCAPVPGGTYFFTVKPYR